MRRKIIIMIFAMISLFSGCTSKEEVPLEEVSVTNEEETEQIKRICVYVCGAVVKEGVYELPKGSRVYEAVEQAGGFCENAASQQVNQAQVLEDEMKIYIPTLEEVELSKTQDSGKINLNTATKDQLMTLPGVGESKANSIIEYREENGGFQKIEDIMEISGIKEGLFAQIKDYIVI